MNIEFDCSNSYRCWECEKECFLKICFDNCTEAEFFEILNATNKYAGGQALAAGFPFEVIQEQERINTLTLVTARKKYLEHKK